MGFKARKPAAVKPVENGWVPVEEPRFVNEVGHWHVKCLCYCGKSGNPVVRSSGELGSQRCPSCASKLGRHNLGHGHCVDHELSPTYKTWQSMRSRCKHPYVVGYENYGGRGIKVCEKWQTFDGFLSDMGPRPDKNYSIDRIDVDGDYEPGNCRWASRAEQARNRTDSRNITYNGETMIVGDWAKRVGIGVVALINRIKVGWPLEDALTVGPSKPNWLRKNRPHLFKKVT